MLKKALKASDFNTLRVLLSNYRTLLMGALLLLAGRVFDARAATIVQALGADFVAFEAEGAEAFTNSATIRWESVPDLAASRGVVLYARGESSLGIPGGVATYRIRFTTPGKYILYSRWKADSAVTDISPFGANSFSYPRTLGPAPVWVRSLANERDVPESLIFDWTEEFVEYDVKPEDIASGTPAIFLIGTREAGLLLDRLVLKLTKGATGATLDALPNSPDESTVPAIESVWAGNDLNTVAVRFSRAIEMVSATNFVSGNLTIASAEIDPADPRRVLLLTSDQSEGSEYTLAMSNVAGASKAPISPISAVSFRAARFLPGWVEVRIYTSSIHPVAIEALDELDYSSAEESGRRVELRGYFIPPEDGRYNLHMRNSGETEVNLYSEELTTNLFSGVFTERNERYSNERFISTPFLTAGSRIRVVAVLAYTNGPVFLSFAGRLSESSDDPGSLPALSGAGIGALLNPDAAELRILEPIPSAAVTGGASVSFSVEVSSRVKPIYYQWQRNGEDIPGATGASHTTPVLTAGDTGLRYRVAIKAGGQGLTSAESVVTVSPGRLGITRNNNDVVVRWEAGAAGATLEAAVALGSGAQWTPVRDANPITAAGTFTSNSGDDLYFRMRY